LLSCFKSSGNAAAADSATGDTARLKNADAEPKEPFPTLSVKLPPA